MEKPKRKRMGLVSDALLLCGGGFLTTGAGILHIAAGFIVAGVCCIGISWLTSLNGGGGS